MAVKGRARNHFQRVISTCHKDQLDQLDQCGQSVLEFVFMLPLIIGLAMMMFRVNSVIQMSIVNQQYARAQGLALTFNSPIYPLIRIINGSLIERGYNQMVIGVSEEPAPKKATDPNYKPTAAHGYIARKKNVGDNTPQMEPASRADVRVRTTISLCTQANVIKADGKNLPILPMAGAGEQWNVNGLYKIPTDAKRYPFEICRGAQ